MMNSHGTFHHIPSFFCALSLYIFVALTTGAEEVLPEEEWLLDTDEGCLSVGGICVKSDYCKEADKENATELCSGKGACCHKVPEEASCYFHGGHCTEDCGNVQNFGQLECPEGETCCLLIF